MGYREGANLVLDFKYPFQHFNRIKNHWHQSDPVTALFDAQPGMIASDADDEKLYHFTGQSPGFDEILQENFSSDKTPRFHGLHLTGDLTCANLICPGTGHDGFSDYVANEHIDWTDAASNFKTTGTVTSPTIYGSVASGGDLTLYSTSHGTLGQIKLESDLETDRWLDSHTNTFIGVGVVGAGNLAHTTGEKGWANSFFGNTAGSAITTGYYNSFFGYAAGLVNTTGHHNSFFGYAVGSANTTGDYNSFLGNVAGLANTTGHHNSFFGYATGRFQSDGSTPLQTPENSIYIGASTKSGSDPAGGEDAIDNEIVIGYDAIGNGAQTVTLGNTNITELHCQVALTVDSDERIKKDVVPVNAGLAFIEALNPITFKRVNPFDYPEVIKPCNYKDREITEKDKNGKDVTILVKADARPPDDENLYMGLVAQQVEAVLTTQGIDTDIVSTSNIGKKSIKYGSLIMPLIKAVQELSEQNKTLSAKIVALEKK